MPRALQLGEHPEANVAAFALLLNLPWEFAQMPLYRCADTLSTREAAAFCAVASLVMPRSRRARTGW